MHAADGTGLHSGRPRLRHQVHQRLTAYLSGDTGIHTEMKTVVNEYHKANLAILQPRV
jgi:hypothetical protein